MRIIQAAPEDLDAIISLNSQLCLNDIDCWWDKPSRVLEKINQSSFYVLKHKKPVLGAMCLHMFSDINPGEAWIETLAIHPDHHQKGYGSLLIDFAKHRAKENNKTLLTVGSFCAYRVREFYLKCGFRIEPGIHFYKGLYPFYWFYMELLDKGSR